MPSLATLRLIFSIAPWAAILLLLGWGARVNDLRDRWHRQYQSEHQARIDDRKTYVQAQKDAAEKNRAEVAKVEAQSKRISDNEKDAYLRDHAELVRLRQQQLAAPKGSAGTAGPSPSPAPTQGADGDELHVSPDQYLQAQEIELRLMHLQNWVEQQLTNH